MNLTHKKEAPGLLAGAAGASRNKEGYDEHAPHGPSIPCIALDSNLLRCDLVVQAIRILARRGRQLREAAYAAGQTAIHNDGSGEHVDSMVSVPDVRSRRNGSEG